jgi:tetratricopeptide (TPR) repeat protein
MLDIKHIDVEKHKELTGCSNERVLAFARYLEEKKIPTWIRHVVVEGYTDSEKDLLRLGEFIGSLKNVKALDVLPYHTMGEAKYKEMGIKYRLEGVPSLPKTAAAQAKAKMSQVLMQKANTLVKAKDYAGAIAACNLILADNPDNAMAALLLGQCYSATGNFDKAEEALAIAAANGKEKQANKELSKLFAKKAAVAFNEKKTQLAYDFAVKSNEYLENSRALNIAGKTAMQLGKLEEGLAYLEKYVAAAPNAKDANQMRFNIAAAAQKLGDKEKAKEYYQQILADPKLGAEAKKQLDALNK